jgi:hypothetical protein
MTFLQRFPSYVEPKSGSSGTSFHGKFMKTLSYLRHRETEEQLALSMSTR